MDGLIQSDLACGGDSIYGQRLLAKEKALTVSHAAPVELWKELELTTLMSLLEKVYGFNHKVDLRGTYAPDDEGSGIPPWINEGYLEKYPRLWSHILRKLDCGKQGVWKDCSNVACRHVNFFNGPCGSIICRGCGHIIENRLKKTLARNMADCIHHYLVFTVPPDLRTGYWEDIDKCFKAARLALGDVLGPTHRKTKDGLTGGYWGAWGAPHVYGSTSMDWHPHVNIILVTDKQLKGYKWLAPIKKISERYKARLEEVFGKSTSYPVHPELHKRPPVPELILKNLVGYSTVPPLPKHIRVTKEGTLKFRIPHGDPKKKNPFIECTLDEFLAWLNRLVPPKHFRGIRRWGIYNANHKLYKEKPFTPVDTSLDPEYNCTCCDSSLRMLAIVGSDRVVHLGCSVLGPDSNGFRYVHDELISGIIQSQNRRSLPPDPSNMLERLKEEHDRCCPHHKQREFDSGNNILGVLFDRKA